MPRASKTPSETQAGSPEGLPSGVRLQSVYGFIDEYGDRWHWDVGQVVRNPFVIAILIMREAPVVVV
jgi:hypothetical protein